MGSAAALQLGRILDRARQSCRVGHGQNRAAILLDDEAQAFRRERRVERHLAARRRDPRKFAFQRLRGQNIGELGQIGLGFDGQLFPREKELRQPLGSKDGKAQRQRGVRHVPPADVEGPGKRGRVRQHGMARAILAKRFGEAGDLVLRQFAGKADRLDLDLFGRRRRSVRPDRIDEVVFDGHQRRTGLVQRPAQRGSFGHRMKPRIKADLHAGAGIRLKPFRRRVLHEAVYVEGCCIDLRARLKRVAAVHKQDRA